MWSRPKLSPEGTDQQLGKPSTHENPTPASLRTRFLTLNLERSFSIKRVKRVRGREWGNFERNEVEWEDDNNGIAHETTSPAIDKTTSRRALTGLLHNFEKSCCEWHFSNCNLATLKMALGCVLMALMWCNGSSQATHPTYRLRPHVCMHVHAGARFCRDNYKLQWNKRNTNYKTIYWWEYNWDEEQLGTSSCNTMQVKLEAPAVEQLQLWILNIQLEQNNISGNNSRIYATTSGTIELETTTMQLGTL